MKQKAIGIIGAGLVGKGLAIQLKKAGHTVKVANSRGPQTLLTFEQQTGARAVDISEVALNVDFLILAIPLKNVVGLAEKISYLHEATIVLDACNYYPWRDGQISQLNEGMTESVWVAGQLGFPVIKVLNNIIADNMITSSKPQAAPDRVALPVSGDNPEAKNAVSELVEEIGFTAYDAGNLADSWRQQPGQPFYCTDPRLKEHPVLLARADKNKAKANRSRIQIILSKIPPEFSGQDLTAVSRLLIGLDVFKLKSWSALIRFGWAML